MRARLARLCVYTFSPLAGLRWGGVLARRIGPRAVRGRPRRRARRPLPRALRSRFSRQSPDLRTKIDPSARLRKGWNQRRMRGFLARSVVTSSRRDRWRQTLGRAGSLSWNRPTRGHPPFSDRPVSPVPLAVVRTTLLAFLRPSSPPGAALDYPYSGSRNVWLAETLRMVIIADYAL